MLKLAKFIVGLGLLLGAFFVGYNYFLGNEEEQESSKAIIAQVQGLTGSVVDLLKSEKGKYDHGKYDNAMSKISNTASVVRKKVSAMGHSGQEIMDKLETLETHKQQLEEDLTALSSSSSELSEQDRNQQAEAIHQQMLKLHENLERLSAQVQ